MRENSVRLILCLLMFAVGHAGRSEEKPDGRSVLRVGAATSNITPSLGELIVGGWMPIPARHVHDELHARCLVLNDGSVQLAIVLCDNVGIPREVFDTARRQITEHTGIRGTHVLMAATHTHSATTARGSLHVLRQDVLTEYQKFLARRIADGVRRAVNQLEPAEVGWGSVVEDSEVFNRRWYVAESSLLKNPFGGIDKVRMNPPRGSGALIRPAGPVDPEVSFLSFRSTDGRPIALLANYSLHYVGGVRSGDVSADYFGYFARDIRRKLNAEYSEPPFVGILSNGTSGDVNNINFRERPQRREPYQKMKEVAFKIAEKVAEANRNIVWHTDVDLDAIFTETQLKVRRPTQQMRQWLQQLHGRSERQEEYHRRERIYAERIAKLKDAPQTVSVPLQVLRIGPVAISAVPFETFAETGLELKDRTPFERTFTIELANGSYGYLPTPEQHKLGGYETWLGTNYVEEESSRRITEQLLNMQQQLRDRKAGNDR